MNLLSPTSKSLLTDLNKKYNTFHTCIGNHKNPVASSLKPFKFSDWNFTELINQISFLLFKWQDAGTFSELLTIETANVVMEGIKPIYDLGVLEELDVDFELKRNLKKNIFVFSHAKTYNQLRAVNDLLKDEKLRLRYNDFKQEVVKLGETFNNNYLKTEYNYAVGTAQEVKKWNKYTETNPDQLLKYSTVGDGRVRQEHAELDGIIRPASDKFWRTFSPLLGYNCRCTTIRVDSDSKLSEVDYDRLEKVEIAEEFKFNPALENQLFFIKTHNYFKSIPNKDKKRIVEEAERLFSEN